MLEGGRRPGEGRRVSLRGGFFIQETGDRSVIGRFAPANIGCLQSSEKSLQARGNPGGLAACSKGSGNGAALPPALAGAPSLTLLLRGARGILWQDSSWLRLRDMPIHAAAQLSTSSNSFSALLARGLISGVPRGRRNLAPLSRAGSIPRPRSKKFIRIFMSSQMEPDIMARGVISEPSVRQKEFGRGKKESA